MNIFIFDTETNGLNGASCLEFFGVKYFLENREVSSQERFHRFYFPHEGYFNNRACMVNGLCEEKVMVRRKGACYPEFFKDDVEVQEFISDVDMFVAHNIRFDLQYIDKSYMKSEVILFDTMKENKNIMQLPGKRGFKNPKLVETAKFYNIDFEMDKFHGAEYDVDITSRIFFKMLKNGMVKY